MKILDLNSLLEKKLLPIKNWFRSLLFKNKESDSINEVFLQEIVNDSPYGIVVYDHENYVILQNENFKKLFDLPESMNLSSQKKSIHFKDHLQYFYARGDFGYEKNWIKF